MSKSARSLHVFAIYLFGLGAALLVVPNLLLTLFTFEPTQEPWIRVVGVLLILITPYYFYASRHELTGFIQLTVWTRASVMLFFLALVLLGLVKPVLLLLSAVDLSGAVWTHLALRAERRPVAANT